MDFTKQIEKNIELECSVLKKLDTNAVNEAMNMILKAYRE